MTIKNAFQIEIPRRAQLCSKGQEMFNPDMEYYSVLCDDSEKGLVRHDFCLTCWELAAQQDFFKNARSQWRSRVPLKKKEDILPLQKEERALELLKLSLTSDLLDDHAEGFVLALYLARKRLLFLREEILKDNGQCIQLYEVAATEEMLSVLKIELPTLQIEKIQIELAKKLKG